MRQAVRFSVAAGAAALMLVAGCTGNGGTSAGGGGGGGAGVAGPARAHPPTGAQASRKPDGAGPQAAPTLPTRALVKTAALTVRVDDVNSAADDAVRIATEQHGDVLSDRRTGTGARASADLTLAVPPDSLEADLGRLARLGRQLSRTTSTTDVTEQVIDVASRVSSMRASLARIRSLYAKATSIGDIIRIESELASREAALESLEAQQADLARQTARARVEVHLRAKPAPVAKQKRHHAAGIAAGFARGWHAFVTSVRWTVTAFGAAFPFLVLVGAVAALALWWRRRARGRSLPAPPPQA